MIELPIFFSFLKNKKIFPAYIEHSFLPEAVKSGLFLRSNGPSSPISSLSPSAVPVLQRRGNHDPLDGWVVWHEGLLDLPAGCVRFGPEVDGFPVFPDEPERATVHGPRGELPGAGEPDAPLCRSGLRTGFQNRASARQRWREPRPRLPRSPLRVRPGRNRARPLGHGTRPHAPDAAGKEPNHRLSRDPPGPPSQRARGPWG